MIDKHGFGNICDAEFDNSGLVTLTDFAMFGQPPGA